MELTLPDPAPQPAAPLPAEKPKGRVLRYLAAAALAAEAVGLIGFSAAASVIGPFTLLLAFGYSGGGTRKQNVEVLAMMAVIIFAPAVLASILLAAGGALFIGSGRRWVVGAAVTALVAEAVYELSGASAFALKDLVPVAIQLAVIAVALAYLPRRRAAPAREGSLP